VLQRLTGLTARLGTLNRLHLIDFNDEFQPVSPPEKVRKMQWHRVQGRFTHIPVQCRPNSAKRDEIGDWGGQLQAFRYLPGDGWLRRNFGFKSLFGDRNRSRGCGLSWSRAAGWRGLGDGYGGLSLAYGAFGAESIRVMAFKH
jgi:hypothetical protein